MGLEPLGEGWKPLLSEVLGRCASGAAASGDQQTAAIDQLAVYLDELVVWNQRTDLTAARSAEELVDLTLADAAMLAAHTQPTERWVDAGSGAGAPAIPLALLTGVDLTLVEPNGKRVAFLRSAIGRLGLQRVRVERGRSDALDSWGWDVAVSRATFSAEDWLIEGARLAKQQVWVLLARGNAPALEGWRAVEDLTYSWPLSGAERRLLGYVRTS